MKSERVEREYDFVSLCNFPGFRPMIVMCVTRKNFTLPLKIRKFKRITETH